MRKIVEKKVLVLMILMVLFTLTGCYSVRRGVVSSGTIEDAEEIVSDEEPVKAKAKKLSLSLTYGYNKTVKLGRYMRANAKITNEGNNFVGSLRVIIPMESGDNVIYQKEFNIPAGETKDISLDIPINSGVKKLTFGVVNEKEKTVVEQEVNVNILYNTDVLFVGVLTDDYNALSYLSSSTTKTFHITEDTFPDDYLGLDTLDIIVINDFNTSTLSEDQYNAIKEFVNNGGTLVLGTGATGNKTLGLFQDDFLVGRTGELVKEKIAFTNDTMTKEILPMDMEGAKSVLSKKGIDLINRVDIGFGNVQVVHFDMGLNYAQWETAGNEIVTSLKENLSDEKKSQIGLEFSGSNFIYKLFESLGVTDETSIPKVGKYVLILGIYVVFIGPILYLILKKKDKRNLTWVMVPAISVIFAFIVYTVGGETRLRNPYTGYLSFLTLGEENLATEELYFSVTAPYNRKYGFEASGDYDITALNKDQYRHYGSYDDDKDKKSDYKTAITYEGEKTVVEMKDYAAFTPVYFKSKSKVGMTGTYESDLYFDKGVVAGTIKSNLDFDLSNAFVYTNNSIIQVGDVKVGEDIHLSDKQSVGVVSRDNLYSNNIMEEIAGGRPYDSNAESDAVRRYYAMEYFLESKLAYQGTGDYLIGFSTAKEEKNLVQEIGFKTAGIKIVIMPLNIDYSFDEYIHIPGLDPYMKLIEGEYDSAYRYINGEKLIMEYNFPTKDHIISIDYLKNQNLEFDTTAYDGFYGTIEAYNNKTEQYDVIFTSGVEKKWEDFSEYFDENNTLLLRYVVDQKNMDTHASKLPILSAVKEMTQ